MFTQSLTSGWTFRQLGGEEWLPAQVPGGVHTDLLAAGKIPDPFFADNELKVMWVAEAEWEYRSTFQLTAEGAAQPRLFLVAAGIDPLAEVYLNGQLLGKAENMFLQYRWDVTKAAKAGANELRVVFHSAVNYCKARNAEKPLTGPVGMTLEGGVFVRKAPCHFGWDWGPKLAPIGIWRDIRLEGFAHARLGDVHLRQEHGKQGVTIEAKVTPEVFNAGELTAKMKVTAPDGQTWEISAPVAKGQAVLSVVVNQPQLWWPNGYGAQPLYDVEVTLESGGQQEDRKDYKLGLRTVELRQEPDEWGLSFGFVVNGVPVFAKGSDWIPADSFPTRMTKEAYEVLIRGAAETHQNMLRIWGGGFYEDERFYDLCDQYGILLWHDFMFACYVYPHDEEEFIANIQKEVVYNVRRLRHRACLALWCGNNEMEQGWSEGGGGLRTDELHVLEKAAYEKFFYHTLPGWLQDLDTDHPYWPSSASSNTPMQNANSQERGDAHYWDVWHGRQPFTAYRSQYPRFMSEFGFQSFPPIETVKAYAEEKDWNITSYVMELHQRSYKGNAAMLTQMTDTFRVPKGFAEMMYMSMVLQAEGIRFGVEHWRRNKHRVGGTLYWQLNDCWPVASWSSMDYFGRWKALHYSAKKFFAPLLLSIEDTGTKMDLWLTSDLTAAWEGKARWALMTLDGKALQEGEMEAKVDALGSKLLGTLDFQAEVFGGVDRSRELVFAAELLQGEHALAMQLATFAPNKHLELVDPCLDVQVTQEGGQAMFTVAARSLARFVELKLEGADAVFSDNYFDVLPGKPVRVSCAMPAGWDLGKVKSALRVMDLFQSF